MRLPAMHPLERKLATELSPLQGGSLLLAVSGGPDSVALLRGVLNLRPLEHGPLAVAHFNHGLRVDAAVDQDFVHALCTSLGVVCEVGQADRNLCQQTAGVGLEAAARQARYRFLSAQAENLRITHVLTAHTADDQAETVLHRILRGTGLRGLKGIERARPLNERCQLVRPLLDVSRREVVDYLASIGQTARQDPTNAQTKQTRNRIRNELIPLLKRDFNPDVDQALLRLGRLAGEVGAITNELVAQGLRDYVESTEDFVAIQATGMARLSPYLIRQVLARVWQLRHWPEREMDHAQWLTLERMIVEGRPTARSLPGGVRAKRQGEQLTLTRPVDRSIRA